ncbi:high mobility group protein 20A [Cloeon dipterum]|uniref:high mobility group protein 20A n=1 Tax=Cloeon dipterum TaxID=197152 RepID=UPI00321F9BB5
MADDSKSTPGKSAKSTPGKNAASPPKSELTAAVTNGNASHQDDKERPRKRKESAKNKEGKAKENKAKRRKRMKDAAAPKHPLSGYVRFMNEHRERIKAENPKANFTVVTKILASEWAKLAANEKQQYLDAADQDRERYNKELDAYKQTDAYKLYTKKQKEQKHAKLSQVIKPKNESEPKTKPAKSESSSTKDANTFTLDIPIFTEEFLDHNKARETELRQLRKSTVDYEQQNSILQTHLTNMQSAVDKLEVEVMQQMTSNAALKQHLDQMRSTLVSSLAHLPLPGTCEPPNIQTIDGYMVSIQQLSSLDHQENKSFLANVKSAINALQFHV